MKRILILLTILIYNLSYSQKNDDLDLLIYLGSEAAKYNNQYPPKYPPESLLKELSEIKNENCQFVIDFTLETLKESNQLFNKRYLIKPSKENLKHIYTINVAMGLSGFLSGDQLRQQVKNNSKLYPSYYDLVDTYYSSLFTAINNRNRGAEFSITNLDLDAYNLVDKTEKAIFYFKYLNLLSKTALFPILSNRDVTKVSCSEFNKFPTINGKDYYYYTDFDFKDFPSRLVNMDDSYKHYYIDETYKLIFMNIKCLEKNLISHGDINEIVKNSILSNKELHDYCERPDILKEILSKYSNY